MKSSLLRFVLPLAALAFVAPGSALAQKNSGTPTGPTVIPGGTVTATYVIDKPGSYILGGNRLMSDRTKAIIRIDARDVTLDLGGFGLSHVAGDHDISGWGIQIPQPENIEVRNGSIVAAGSTALVAGKGNGLRALNLRIVAPGGHGISAAHTKDVLIEQCHIADAGSTGILLGSDAGFVRDCIVSNPGYRGIEVGDRNQVSRVVVRGGSRGVQLGVGSVLEDSFVTGAAEGILGVVHTTVRNCQITNNSVGLVAWANGTALYGNRFAQNTTHVQGTYYDGGGNIIP